MMAALTVNAANAPPSISQAPRDADLFVGPELFVSLGRERRRIRLMVTNLTDLLIEQRKW
jgi:hypothetical protein